MSKMALPMPSYYSHLFPKVVCFLTRKVNLCSDVIKVWPHMKMSQNSKNERPRRGPLHFHFVLMLWIVTCPNTRRPKETMQEFHDRPVNKKKETQLSWLSEKNSNFFSLSQLNWRSILLKYEGGELLLSQTVKQGRNNVVT